MDRRNVMDQNEDNNNLNIPVEFDEEVYEKVDQNPGENEDSNEHVPNPNSAREDPIYMMTVELEKGRSEIIKIFADSTPEELAYEFCKKNNLDYNSLTFLKTHIQSLLEQLHNGNSYSKHKSEANNCIQEEDEDENPSQKTPEGHKTSNKNHSTEKSNMQMEVDISKTPASVGYLEPLPVNLNQKEEGEKYAHNDIVNKKCNEISSTRNLETVEDSKNPVVKCNTTDQKTNSEDKNRKSENLTRMPHNGRLQNLFSYQIFLENLIKKKKAKDTASKRSQSPPEMKKNIKEVKNKPHSAHDIKTKNSPNDLKASMSNTHNQTGILEEIKKSENKIHAFLKQDSSIRKIYQQGYSLLSPPNRSGNPKEQQPWRTINLTGESLPITKANNSGYYFDEVIPTLSSTQAHLKRGEYINYGERLYRKGLKLQEETNKKIEEMKKGMQTSDDELFTFYPHVNTISPELNQKRVELQKMYNSEEYILNYRAYVDNRLQKLREKHVKPVEYSFSPQINRRSQQMEEEKKRKMSQEIPKRYEELYQNYKTKQARLEKNEEKFYSDYLFRPILTDYQSTQLNTSFKERQEAFITRSRENQNRLREIVYNPTDQKTGQNLFEPLLLGKNGNKCPPRHTSNIFFNLYSDAQKYKLNQLQRESDIRIREQQNRGTHVSEDSDSIFQKKKENSFRAIFNLLDSDGDDLISVFNMDLKKIPSSIVNILQPIITELREENETLNESEFVRACDQIYGV